MSQLKTHEGSSCESSGKGELTSVRYAKPAYRIRENASAYTVELDVPGARRESVEVTLEDGVLEVRADRANTISSDWRPVAGISRHNAYRLRLGVGDFVQPDGVAANLEHGVLRLELPKLEERKARKIAIQ